MEKLEEIETHQDERKTEARDVKTKEHENTNTRLKRAYAGKGVEHLEMKFGGGIYATQFTTSTGEKK